ncbi:hypothetical protein ACP4OV_014694 [Aristida adscensionis]
MEATRFGFDPALPRAYKFDPTDADLVAFYLIPRALRLPNPHDHAVIDDDPASCPPWELLRRNNHAGSRHAFFFPPPRGPAAGAHVARRVPAGEHGPGGTWRGQKGELGRLVLARGSGAGAPTMEFVYRKLNLSYCRAEDGGKKTSGWVMHEYQITSPPLRSGVVLAHVKITNTARKALRQQAAAAAAAAAAQPGMAVPWPYQDQPGPSSYLAGGGQNDGEASSSGAQNGGVAHQGGGRGGVGMVGETGGYFTRLLNGGEGHGYGFDDVSNCFTQDRKK